MSDFILRYRKENPDAYPPFYAHEGDSGFDLRVLKDYTVPPGGVVCAETGLSFEIPHGFEIQIRLRSGASLNTPFVMPNAPATIDSGYRGAVGIILRNMDMAKETVIKRGDRIAQGVLCPIIHASLVETTETFKSTERGNSGYGSTGLR